MKTIRHKNHYDYTKQHRHSYFEVQFFIEGGGKNLIDFKEHEVKSNACYIVYPNQIHLLNRASGSHGLLLQFTEDSVLSSVLQRKLQERSWHAKTAMLFENDVALMKENLQVLEVMQSKLNRKASFEVVQHLLEALLLDLLSSVHKTDPVSSIDAEFYRFQQLLDLHYSKEHHVAFYSNELNLSEKKLSALSKKHLGITPLQVIHKRILLEARRQLVFEEKPHKEIAYDLGFDSPSSFSAFIKKKTNFTASEIQAQVAEIHKR